MKKTKSLVASLVAIVICFAMLIGTTYAWFTDSVINTNNIIKSGNVSIELWHNSDAKADMWGWGYSETNAEQVDSSTKLFLNNLDEEFLWEPNASVGENFRIKNVGTLALKYEFRIKPVSKTIVDGKSLTDVILMQAVQFDYSVVGSPSGLGQWDDVNLASDFVLAGTLLPNEVADYHISLDWFPTANDNDYANMNMWLGIELIATQVSYESDGYGNGFDNGAQFPNVSASAPVENLPADTSAVLETKGENPVSAVVPAKVIDALPDEVTGIALVHTEPVVENGSITFESVEIVDQNGQIIDLEELELDEKIEVTLPAQTTFPAGEYVSVYHDDELVAVAKVNADGTISYEVGHFCEVTLSTPDGVIDTAMELVAAFDKDEDIVLQKDITVDATLLVAEGRTVNLDLNGKTLTGTQHKSIGAVIKNQGTLTVVNGTISSTAENGGSTIQNNGTAIVENVVLNGAPNANGSWPSYAVNNVGDMTINNAKITSYHGGLASYGEGAIITLNNSELDMAGIPAFTSHGFYTYNDGKIVVNGGVYANKATDQASTGASVINGAVEINGGKFSGRIENYYGTPVIKAGDFSVSVNAKFVAEGSKVTKVSDNKYIVAEEGVYVVYDATTLKDALTATAGTDAVISMACDITMYSADHMGGNGYGKAGITVDGQTLVGNGNKLTVRNANATWDCSIYVKSGTIKDIVVAGAMRGIFTGGTNGDIYLENVSFDDVIYTYNSDAGNKNFGVYATNCTFNGWTSFSDCHKEVIFTNCTFSEGCGYQFARPYQMTSFIGCEFEAGYEIDTSYFAGLIFTDCTYAGEALTAECPMFYKGINGAIIG